MKKRLLLSLLTLGVLASSISMNVSPSHAPVLQVNAATSTLPTTIDLKDNSEEDIRSYYSSLLTLSEEERKGTNLLKNLRPILRDQATYYVYGSGGANPSGVTAIYSITDRDWAASPASSVVGGTYDASTKVITGYSHKNEILNNSDLCVRMLYVDYEKQEKTPFLIEETKNANFDKEHVWSKSIGFSEFAEGPAGTDLHHLIAGEKTVNQQVHNNNPYGVVSVPDGKYDGTAAGTYPITGNKRGSAAHEDPRNASGQAVFEPNDADKGRIARALLYMAACYNNYSGSETITASDPNLELVDYVVNSSAVSSSATETAKYGILSDLLDWNRRFKPTEFEIHRNNLIYNNYQHNRNPFIDFPEWADYVWGVKGDLTPTGFADPSLDAINNWTADLEGEVSFSETSLDFTVGDSSKNVAATSSNGNEISWNVEPKGIVELSSVVSASGEAINVTPKAEGEATLTASFVLGRKTVEASISVNVKGSSDPSEAVEDVLSFETLGVQGTSYKLYENRKINNATYSAFVSKSNGGVALNSKSTTARGIVQTKSGGTPVSVSVDWVADSLAAGTKRAITVYGSQNPFTSINPSLDPNATLLASISYPDSTKVTWEGECPYLGFASLDGVVYFNAIHVSYRAKTEQITGIIATCDVSFHPGETLLKNQIQVKDNLGNDISYFELLNEKEELLTAYDFSYEDAPSGGKEVKKTFTVRASSFTATVSVSISRVAPMTFDGASQTLDDFVNFVMFEDIEGQCQSKFLEAKERFFALSNEDKTSFLESESYCLIKAKERLFAWANFHGENLISNEGKVSFVPMNSKAFPSKEIDWALVLYLSLAGLFGCVIAFLKFKKSGSKNPSNR